ncbi:MAG: hypothetical protein QNJ61_00880 [Desulfobacterales bacterium]|nr:hypothetical protein [Desulfobacterales bacterium]
MAEDTDPQGKISPVAPWPAGGIQNQVLIIRVAGHKEILTRHQAETGMNELADCIGAPVNGRKVQFLLEFQCDRKQDQFKIFLVKHHERMAVLIIPGPFTAGRDVKPDTLADGFEFFQFDGGHAVTDR